MKTIPSTRRHIILNGSPPCDPEHITRDDFNKMVANPADYISEHMDIDLKDTKLDNVILFTPLIEQSPHDWDISMVIDYAHNFAFNRVRKLTTEINELAVEFSKNGPSQDLNAIHACLTASIFYFYFRLATFNSKKLANHFPNLTSLTNFDHICTKLNESSGGAMALIRAKINIGMVYITEHYKHLALLPGIDQPNIHEYINKIMETIKAKDYAGEFYTGDDHLELGEWKAKTSFTNSIILFIHLPHLNRVLKTFPFIMYCAQRQISSS